MKKLTFMIWGLIFFVFLFFSSEDRLFKNWKEELGEFVSWDGEIREWARVNLFPGAMILIDIPEWKDWDKPFSNKGLGNIRRSLYRKAFPRSSNYLKRLSLLVPMPRLIRLDSRKRFREDEKTSLLELAPESFFSPQGLKTLMLLRNIDFYLCSFTNYKLKTQALNAAGFQLLHSNPRLMLWSVKNE
jgi:hypothetical protein